MRTPSLLLLCVAALAAGCTAASSRPTGSNGIDAAGERRAVYEAVLRTRVLPENDPVLVVDPILEGGRGRVPSDVSAQVPIEWFSEADWNALATECPGDMPDARWTAFNARWPRAAWIRLGQVRFLEGGRLARVNVTETWGGLSGSVKAVLLERGPGGWHVRESAPICTA